MKIVKVNDKVVISDNVDTQIYTVDEVFSSKGIIKAKLVYQRLDGATANAGIVDVSLLKRPTFEQLNHS